MEICKEKHKQVDEKFDLAERRINDHSKRIDKLEQFRSSTEIEIKNLVIQIKSLVSTMKLFMMLGFSTFFGFFIWYIQKL